MGTHSSHERQALADALTAAGPEAPTLCEGWTTLDLVVHLLTRERRPDASISRMVPFLAAHAKKVDAELRSRPYDALVDDFRLGPPRLNPFTVSVIDERMNLGEFFIHTEDVRRATPEWTPRMLEPELSEAIWRDLSFFAKLALRRSPVPVRLVRMDGAEIATGKAGVPVRLHGEPGELLLYVSGRTSAAQVELTGPVEQLKAFREITLSI